MQRQTLYVTIGVRISPSNFREASPPRSGSCTVLCSPLMGSWASPGSFLICPGFFSSPRKETPVFNTIKHHKICFWGAKISPNNLILWPCSFSTNPTSYMYASKHLRQTAHVLAIITLILETIRCIVVFKKKKQWTDHSCSLAFPSFQVSHLWMWPNYILLGN